MDPMIFVRGGRVRGRMQDGVVVFRSIPYARSPEGPLRWRPPLPREPWDGVRDAIEPGPIAPQPPAAPGMSLPGDPTEESEDCLHLSVWTPGLDDRRRPVMVWVHGGAFTSGTEGGAMYDGRRLAARGDVVVVSIDYRLGALGFLGHPCLGPGSLGNWGLLDQVAALHWVQNHIADLGGDPANVTLFGESAGGMSVAALLAAPSARGLFVRAIIQSGPPYAHSGERAEQIGNDLGKELGLPTMTREVLENVPFADLVQAGTALESYPTVPGELPRPFLPVVDGELLPGHPLDLVAAGRGLHVPLLIGTNRDEMALYAIGGRRAPRFDEDSLLAWMALAAPDAAAEPSIRRYREVRERRGEGVTPRDLWIALASDVVFRWPSLRFAAAHRRHQPATFVYLFTWESPVLDGALGSSHGLEIPFVFGTVQHPAIAAYAGRGPEAEALSDRMQAAWLSFARGENPSVPDTDPWPAWDVDRRATMVFGREVELVDRPRSDELAVWEAVAALPD